MASATEALSDAVIAITAEHAVEPVLQGLVQAARGLGADATVDYTEPGWAGATGPLGVVFGGVGGAIGAGAFERLRALRARRRRGHRPPPLVLRKRRIRPRAQRATWAAKPAPLLSA